VSEYWSWWSWDELARATATLVLAVMAIIAVSFIAWLFRDGFSRASRRPQVFLATLLGPLLEKIRSLLREIAEDHSSLQTRFVAKLTATTPYLERQRRFENALRELERSRGDLSFGVELAQRSNREAAELLRAAAPENLDLTIPTRGPVTHTAFGVVAAVSFVVSLLVILSNAVFLASFLATIFGVGDKDADNSILKEMAALMTPILGLDEKRVGMLLCVFLAITYTIAEFSIGLLASITWKIEPRRGARTALLIGLAVIAAFALFLEALIFGYGGRDIDIFKLTTAPQEQGQVVTQVETGSTVIFDLLSWWLGLLGVVISSMIMGLGFAGKALFERTIEVSALAKMKQLDKVLQSRAETLSGAAKSWITFQSNKSKALASLNAGFEQLESAKNRLEALPSKLKELESAAQADGKMVTTPSIPVLAIGSLTLGSGVAMGFVNFSLSEQYIKSAGFAVEDTSILQTCLAITMTLATLVAGRLAAPGSFGLDRYWRGNPVQSLPGTGFDKWIGYGALAVILLNQGVMAGVSSGAGVESWPSWISKALFLFGPILGVFVFGRFAEPAGATGGFFTISGVRCVAALTIFVPVGVLIIIQALLISLESFIVVVAGPFARIWRAFGGVE
jgi:hypothetical protein